MKVLLLEDVRKLGSKGEIVEVSDGYARNYIIPQKLGREATKQVLNEWEQRKKTEASRKEQERLEAIELVRRLETTPIEIKARAGEGGRLFGSITSQDIEDALRTQYHVDLDRKKITLKEPIRAIGNYSIEIRLHPDAVGKLAVRIVPGE